MSSQKVIDWRIRTKARIVESMGGKCEICGYFKCNAALELHHLDPSKKQLSFAGIRANPKAWKTIVNELRKCVLLCSNCHKEVEAGFVSIENKKYFIEEYKDPSFFNNPETKINQYAHFGKKNYKEKICKCGLTFKPTGSRQTKCHINCI